jgi:hypothetical protein
LIAEKDAPIEFFLTAAVYDLGEDKNHLPVIYFRAKTVLRIKKLRPILHLIIVNIINKIDNETNGKGFVCVLDLHEVGVKNADLNVIQFIINILRKYFPLAISRVIVYNTPWYLKGKQQSFFLNFFVSSYHIQYTIEVIDKLKSFQVLKNKRFEIN